MIMLLQVAFHVGSMLDHRVVYIMCVVMFMLLQAACRVGSTLDHHVVYI